MRLPGLDPITKKRLQRFRRIKRGYYSFMTLVILFVISLFSEFVANDRAIFVQHEGKMYFPTFRYHDMATFGQEDEYGFDDVEANYRALKDEKKAFVIMPLIPFDPYEPDFTYDEPPPNRPDRYHWLGTDGQGRDVLARLLYGFRISMIFALCLVIVSQTTGTIIGSLQGYRGGIFDLLSQRFVEIWSSLPFLFVVIILASMFRVNVLVLVLIYAMFQWIGITYYMRTEMYREKTREYCLAAQSYGASGWRIMFRHLLPNCITPLVTLTPFTIVGAIFGLTALDFLGYGLPPPTPSWGELIGQGLQSDNRDSVWLSISPFGAISFTLILVTFVGESVREAFDPKQYARYK